MPTNTETRVPRGQRRGTGKTPAAATETVAQAAEATPAPRTMGKGWGAIKKSSGGGKSGFAEDVKLKDNDSKGHFFAFIDNMPFVVYGRHWIKGLPTGMKFSHSCPQWKEVPEDCRLDDELGLKAEQRVCFNVIDLDDLTNEDKSPKVKVWAVGVKVARQLQELAEDPKLGPLNDPDRFWNVKRSAEKVGKKTNYDTTITRLKARDLREDYDKEPLDVAAREEYAKTAWTEPTYVFYSKEEDIDAVVEEVSTSGE